MSPPHAIETFASCRVSPVGAHTDHQGGLTLGLALREGIRFQGSSAEGTSSSLTSRGHEGTCTLTESAASSPLWQRLLSGLRERLHARVPLPRGIEGHLSSDLASGGVASSAAVQVVVARALFAANAVSFPAHDLMQIICANERAVTGAPVGVLDPAVILEGREGELVVVDAADGSCKKHRFSRRFPKHEWALVDVGVPRVLGETPYAARVEECRRAAEFLGSASGRLGELSLPALRKHRGAMSPDLVKRAEHYFGEVRRVRLAISAAAEGDLAAFAAIMNASADSLTQLFEVGVPETVRALAELRAVPGVLAVTYAGGGFGGHLLCLVEAAGTHALGLAACERGMQARAIHPL